MRESTETHPADVPEPKKQQDHTDEVFNEADIDLDRDGWPKTSQDEEDPEFLCQSLDDVPVARLSSKNLENRAQKEKVLKAHHRGKYGVIYKPKIEGYYMPNSTGCARTEGVSKIPLSEKRKYLPQYTKAQRPREEAQTQVAAAEVNLTQIRLEPGPVITTSRADRLAKRNAAKKVNAKTAIISNEDDNKARLKQLCKRMKDLRLGRSAIHGWGLFTEAKVAANDMVIEFVGEVVSQKVSEKREKKYLESGLGSSYLFSLNNGFVVDGTKRGNISRFINHSCTPNVASKIRDVNGSPRVFFFASRDIEAGEFSPRSPILRFTN